MKERDFLGFSSLLLLGFSSNLQASKSLYAPQFIHLSRGLMCAMMMWRT